jgi:hypothetical protein
MPVEKPLLALAIVLVLMQGVAVRAQNQQQLKYSILFPDTEQMTHFRDEYLSWRTGTDPKTLTTPFQDAERIGFLRLLQGYKSDWHPAPLKQFVMVLTGLMEVEAGDGTRRQFAPGSVLLVTDTQGRGHRTSTVGDLDVLLVWVPVP